MDRPPQTPTPGWQPDPYGRHEYRYWDGAAWSDQVSDGGVVSSDPVQAAAQGMGGGGAGWGSPAPAPTAKARTGLWVAIGVLVVAAIVAGAVILLSGGDDDEGGETAGGGPEQTDGPPVTDEPGFDGCDGDAEGAGDSTHEVPEGGVARVCVNVPAGVAFRVRGDTGEDTDLVLGLEADDDYVDRAFFTDASSGDDFFTDLYSDGIFSDLDLPSGIGVLLALRDSGVSGDAEGDWLPPLPFDASYFVVLADYDGEAAEVDLTIELLDPPDDLDLDDLGDVDDLAVFLSDPFSDYYSDFFSDDAFFSGS